jgi:hypothetical protein
MTHAYIDGNAVGVPEHGMRNIPLLLAVLVGCGPTTINVTTSEGGEGSTDQPLPDTSTGLGATSLASTAIDADTSAGSSSSTGSESSDSGAPTSSTGGSSSGEPPVSCEVPPGSLVCLCDGEETFPMPTPLGCFCGAVEMDPDACCVPGMACWCEKQDPPGPCMEKQCYDPTTAECSCPLEQTDEGCFCGSVPFPENACD